MQLKVILREVLTWYRLHVFLFITLMSAVPSENSSLEGGISVAKASGTFTTSLAGLESTEMI